MLCVAAAELSDVASFCPVQTKAAVGSLQTDRPLCHLWTSLSYPIRSPKEPGLLLLNQTGKQGKINEGGDHKECPLCPQRHNKDAKSNEVSQPCANLVGYQGSLDGPA